MWDRQVNYFSDKYTVVRFDTRGYGQSDPPIEPYLPADDLYYLLKFLKIDRACIVGLSMGRTQAIDYAIAHPQAMSALVVIAGTPGWLPYSDGMARRTAAISATAKEKGPALLVEGWLNDPMLAVARTQPSVAHEMRIFLNQNAAGMSSLPFMRPPTLIMVGDRDDPEIVERAQLMSREIPGARKLIIKNADHMVNIEKPHEFNRRVDNVLRGQGTERH